LLGFDDGLLDLGGPSHLTVGGQMVAGGFAPEWMCPALDDAGSWDLFPGSGVRRPLSVIPHELLTVNSNYDGRDVLS
jgi:hypothetical protein